MQIFNGHYNVADLIEVNRVTKDEILNFAVEGRVPIAVWADNVFVWPVHYSQQNKRYQKMAKLARLCKGEWLYVKPSYLRKYKPDVKAISMRLFRSAFLTLDNATFGLVSLGETHQVSLDWDDTLHLFTFGFGYHFPSFCS